MGKLLSGTLCSPTKLRVPLSYRLVVPTSDSSCCLEGDAILWLLSPFSQKRRGASG